MEMEFDGNVTKKHDRGVTIKKPSGATTMKDVIDLKTKFDDLNKKIDDVAKRLDKIEKDKKEKTIKKQPEIME